MVVCDVLQREMMRCRVVWCIVTRCDAMCVSRNDCNACNACMCACVNALRCRACMHACMHLCMQCVHVCMYVCAFAMCVICCDVMYLVFNVVYLCNV